MSTKSNGTLFLVVLFSICTLHLATVKSMLPVKGK
jgi:hypothetical protein